MEQSKEYTQYYHDQAAQGNVVLNPVSERFMQDATNCINTETKPHELSLPEGKPVLNFSIQTGEEFSLEFMHDRVHPRKPAVPKAVGDCNYTTGYMELKGLLGITRTDSENGSDISMLTLVERGPKDFERKNSSLYEEQNKHGYSMPRNPSGLDSGEGVFYRYASSVTSESFSTKMKILCSFGGKILPRPSDGKLRYVGGETRIIRISKDIFGNELKKKTMGIFNQPHTIKYQLPGEDLDALVSVSSDEDLQNMMEECNTTGDGEDSKKLRIFLFTSSDLDDAHYSLNSEGADSEIQYVVAVNGMDLGSRKNSANDLASSSANNLDQLSGQNVDKGVAGSAAGLGGASSLPLTGIPASTSTGFQTSQPLLSSSETHPQLVQGQIMQHEGAFYQLHNQNFNPSSHYSFGEASMPTSTQVMMGSQRILTEARQNGELKSRDSDNLASEVNVKEDGAVQQEVKTEKHQSSMSSQHVPPKPCDGEMINNFDAEVAPASGSSTSLSREFPGLPPQIERKHQNYIQGSSLSDAVRMAHAQLPKTLHDASLHSQGNAILPECPNQESASFHVHPEPSASLQRYYSERTLRRDPGELLKLNRISKSDDSLNSQLLASRSPSRVVQQDLVKDSIDELQNLNLANHPGETLFTGKPLHLDDQVIASDAAGGDGNNPETIKAETVGQNLSGTDPGFSQKGDILIDINDRFPRDFLSDIFESNAF